MNAEFFISKNRVITNYLVEIVVNGKKIRKWFTHKRYILGWVAKKHMLPILNKYHQKYECERNYRDFSKCVYDDWYILKQKFIQTMRSHGVEAAVKELDEFLDKDFFRSAEIMVVTI